MIIHTISGAPRGWRVLLGLAFKGLEADIRYLKADKKEHKSTDFLRINPRGAIPVLEADNLVLRDSIAILAWLDRAWPDRPLWGTTPDEAASIWQIAMEANDYLRAAIDGLLKSVFNSDGTIAHTSDEYMALQSAAGTLQLECAQLEKLLIDQTFFGSSQPSAADAIIFSEIRLIQRAIDTKPIIMADLGFTDMASHYPQLAAWLNRITAQPGVDATFPVHWSG